MAPRPPTPIRPWPATRRALAPCLAAGLIVGCSFPNEALWPLHTGGAPATPETAAAPAPADTAPAAGLPLGAETFAPPGVIPGIASDTPAAREIDELRGQLTGLQHRLAHHNERLQALRAAARHSAGAYHGLAAAAGERLQSAPDPGDRELIALWTEAQDRLAETGQSLTALDGLANDAAATSTLTAILLDSIRGAESRAAADELDRREHAILVKQADQIAAVAARLTKAAARDAARGQRYLAHERERLAAMATAVARGEAYGGPAPAGAAGAALVGRVVPFVVIRFDGGTGDYEEPLQGAVSEALRRRPGALFDLVAVTPSAGAKASRPDEAFMRNAVAVLRSLTAMGVPPERVSLAATASPLVRVNEVHIYVR